MSNIMTVIFSSAALAMASAAEEAVMSATALCAAIRNPSEGFIAELVMDRSHDRLLTMHQRHIFGALTSETQPERVNKNIAPFLIRYLLTYGDVDHGEAFMLQRRLFSLARPSARGDVLKYVVASLPRGMRPDAIQEKMRSERWPLAREDEEFLNVLLSRTDFIGSSYSRVRRSPWFQPSGFGP
jgi:hypothetical protein